MSGDIGSHFYASLGLPLYERTAELTRLIDQMSPFKDLQALFPQLVASVFGVGTGVPAGWGLRTITRENSPVEFDALHRFLSPQGPIFRLCYKLLTDPQLKYHFPLIALPFDIQQMLERGRYPQFYADLINVDPQTMQMVSLALNPFDYYIFHFATHLLNSDINKFTWESSSAYIALSCDYLTHFLPADPTVSVLPLIPYYAGKASLVAPLQTTTRQLHSPSLLLVADPGGLDAHAHAQPQPRNDIWRTETVMQVLTDVWFSVDDFESTRLDPLSYSPKKCPLPTTTGERVKAARILVKQIHSYSSRHAYDTHPRSAALRKCARQCVCARAYKLITYLANTWPLDSSFRLVLELWLSTIQPWRYTDMEILSSSPDRYSMRRREEGRSRPVDASYAQFIAENLPLYTSVTQQLLMRFLRIDLAVPKNAIMLFRLAKVFAQPNLANMVREVEAAAVGQHAASQSADLNWNLSYNWNNMQDLPMAHKWGALAKQAIAELTTQESYEPLWGERGRVLALEVVRRAASAKLTADRVVADIEAKLQQQNKSFWSSFVWSNCEEDERLADRKLVPQYLGAAVQFLAEIFAFDSSMVVAIEEPPDSQDEESSCTHTTHKPHPQMRSTCTSIEYMGDPELAPIRTNEVTVLVRMLYQLATKLNQMYQQEMSEAWRRQDFWGHVSREVLQAPRTVRYYTRTGSIVSQDIGPRLSLRIFASKTFLFWLLIGYLLFCFCGYGWMSYLFALVCAYTVLVFFKASLKQCGLIGRGNAN